MDNSDKHSSVAFVSGDSVTVNGNEGYSVDRRHSGVFRQSQWHRSCICHANFVSGPQRRSIFSPVLLIATRVANRLLCEGNGRVETTRNSFELKGQEQTGHST